MSLLDRFRHDKSDTAAVARERLQIIVAHERSARQHADFLPQMQEEILAVVRKYVPVDQDQVEVQLDQKGRCSVLELNVTFSKE